MLVFEFVEFLSSCDAPQLCSKVSRCSGSQSSRQWVYFSRPNSAFMTVKTTNPIARFSQSNLGSFVLIFEQNIRKQTYVDDVINKKEVPCAEDTKRVRSWPSSTKEISVRGLATSSQKLNAISEKFPMFVTKERTYLVCPRDTICFILANLLY